MLPPRPPAPARRRGRRPPSRRRDHAVGTAPSTDAVRSRRLGRRRNAAGAPSARPRRSRRTPRSPPPAAGDGRRIVFSQSDQRVWLVGTTSTCAHLPRLRQPQDNLDPGATPSTRRRVEASGVDDSGTMEYFVRFAHGDNGAAIGFHDIPINHGTASRPAPSSAPRSRTAASGRPRGRHRAVELRPDGTRSSSPRVNARRRSRGLRQRGRSRLREVEVPRASGHVVVDDVAAEVRRVVGVDRHADAGVGAAAAAGGSARSGTTLSRTLESRHMVSGVAVGGQSPDQRRVLDAADAVVHPLDAEDVDHLARCTRRALLARMRDPAEPQRAGGRERWRRAGGGGCVGLRGVEPDPGDDLPRAALSDCTISRAASGPRCRTAQAIERDLGPPFAAALRGRTRSVPPTTSAAVRRRGRAPAGRRTPRRARRRRPAPGRRRPMPARGSPPRCAAPPCTRSRGRGTTAGRSKEGARRSSATSAKAATRHCASPARGELRLEGALHVEVRSASGARRRTRGPPLRLGRRVGGGLGRRRSSSRNDDAGAGCGWRRHPLGGRPRAAPSDGAAASPSRRRGCGCGRGCGAAGRRRARVAAPRSPRSSRGLRSPGAGSTIRPLVPGGMPWSWKRCSEVE